jgi:putative pyruvate formate lyase activating enzyme
MNRDQFLRSLLLLLFTPFISPGNCKIFSRSENKSNLRITGQNPEDNTKRSVAGFQAGYRKLQASGELKKRGQQLWAKMEKCCLCPRECGANRLAGEKGFCQASAELVISSFHPHHGEERPLSGSNGSGTIFFSNCSLRCVFCINWQISQGAEGLPSGRAEGEKTGLTELCDMMLKLQQMGCHNINIVTPSHYSAHLLLALDMAAEKGLNLPLVYNTCGWERQEILSVLDGVVDIYLPDFKYASAAMAGKYSSGADSYPEITKKALREMQRQVGTAHPAADGLMYRGLMIRHLVMPNNVSGTPEVLKWIVRNLPVDTYVNIMSQYRPYYKAKDYPEIARPLTREEYEQAVYTAVDLGLTNLDIQGMPF